MFCTTLMYSFCILSKTVRLAYVSNHLSQLPVSTKLLLRLVSGKEHDRSLLNRLCKSHEILGQASSLELLSPQTFPSLFIFQLLFFFMLSILFHPGLHLGSSLSHRSQTPLESFSSPLFLSFLGTASRGGGATCFARHLQMSRFSFLIALTWTVYLPPAADLTCTIHIRTWIRKFIAQLSFSTRFSPWKNDLKHP